MQNKAASETWKHKVCFGMCSRGPESIMAGKAWLAFESKKLAGHILSFTQQKQRKRTESRTRLSIFKPHLWWHTSFNKGPHPKTPHPPQRVQPTGDLDFKYLSLWRHFFNSTYLWEGLGSSTTCEENLGRHCPVLCHTYTMVATSILFPWEPLGCWGPPSGSMLSSVTKDPKHNSPWLELLIIRESPSHPGLSDGGDLAILAISFFLIVDLEPRTHQCYLQSVPKLWPLLFSL